MSRHNRCYFNDEDCKGAMSKIAHTNKDGSLRWIWACEHHKDYIIRGIIYAEGLDNDYEGPV